MKELSPKRAKPTRDRALEVGARAHYDDPAYYQKTYAGRHDDIAYYESLLAHYAGPILEYGIGNGRIAIPLARAGGLITGIDRSSAMLRDLKTRLKNEPPQVQQRIQAVRGDMRKVRLDQQFSLVLCTFNTFLHLYTRTDVERFLRRVRMHLAPQGRFVADIALPQCNDLLRDPNRAYGAPRFRHPSTGQLVRYAERFDYDCARQILFVTMEFSPVEAGGTPWVVPLAHRQFFPQELEALFHYNGFEVQDLRGGFHGEPLSPHSDLGVWTCRRAADCALSPSPLNTPWLVFKIRGFRLRLPGF